MKAAIKTGKQRYEIVEIPTPELGRGEVLVRVAYCAICAWCYEEWEADAPESALGPGVTGHEVSGVAEACGPDTARVKPGDRVMIYNQWTCGGCPDCIAGLDTYCEYGHSLHHGFAEYVRVPERNIFHVPGDIPLKYACMITDMIGTPLHAIKRAFSVPLPRDAITVWGLGPVGLFTVQCLRAQPGVGRIVAIDPLPFRREMALSLGADAALGPAAPGFGAGLAAACGKPADYAFNCAIRDPAVIDAAFRALGKNGYLMNITGTAMSGFQTEKRVDSTYYYNRNEHAECMSLVTSGKVRLEPVLTDVFPLAEINAAMAKRLFAKDSCLKVAVCCNESLADL